MTNDKKPLIVIVGPTAVGKTALSIDLAKAFDAEIISGDSMQVYRGMDIGTAKITAEEMENIPHHMLDILDPNVSFNALTFKKMAESMIDDILARSHYPMVVGGTGLYVNGLIYDYKFQGERDVKYRTMIYNDMVKNPSKALEYYQKLMEQRPDLSGIIFKNDYFRISRALEVVKTEGKDIVKNFDMSKNYFSPYRLSLIGLTMDRATLYSRINQRVDLMLESGLIEEVEELLDKGYNKEMQALKAIGYKEIIAAIQGEMSIDEAVELLKKNTRHFAKRQLTWFRRDPNIKWFEVDKMNYDELLQSTKEYITFCLGQK